MMVECGQILLSWTRNYLFLQFGWWNASRLCFPGPGIIYFCNLDGGMQAGFAFLGFE